MSYHQMIIHQTNTNKISAANLDGWEFSCHLCDYRARYLIAAGDQKLEVLNMGNPYARHISSPVNIGDEFGGTLSINDSALENGDFKDFEDQVWLPPDLEQQIDEILRRFDGNTG